MPKKISNEVLQQAQELRTQGKSYEEISKALQVSISWCWQNLKNAQKETKDVVDSLEQKSKSRRGVSKAEIAKAADEIESYVQFAWATFDGEGGYDLRLYDMNEDYKDNYIKRNGEKYKDWVIPLYVKETK